MRSPRRQGDRPQAQVRWAAALVIVVAAASVAASHLATARSPDSAAVTAGGASATPAPDPFPTGAPATPVVVPGPSYPDPPTLGPSVAGDYVPVPELATADTPDTYSEGCHQLRKAAAVVACVYGDPASETVVALVGDSHAAQWQPGLRAVAEARGWRLESYTKTSCPMADVEVWIRKDGQPYTSCTAWNTSMLAALVGDIRPDLLVTSLSGEYDVVVDGAMVAAGPEADALLSQGLARTWSALEDAGIPVVVLMDVPWFPVEVGACIAEQPEAPARCDAERTAGVAASGAAIINAAASAEPRAEVLDLTPALCGPRICPAVIDGVVVMRDEHHITATFSRALAPWIDAGLTFAMW